MERNYEDRFMKMVEKVERVWEMWDHRQDDPIIPMKALRFLEEDVERVHRIFRVLDREEPIGFIRFPSKGHPTAIFPEKTFSRLVEALDKEWISYIETPVLALSALSVEDQKKFRRWPNFKREERR